MLLGYLCQKAFIQLLGECQVFRVEVIQPSPSEPHHQYHNNSRDPANEFFTLTGFTGCSLSHELCCSGVVFTLLCLVFFQHKPETFCSSSIPFLFSCELQFAAVAIVRFAAAIFFSCSSLKFVAVALSCAASTRSCALSNGLS